MIPDLFLFIVGQLISWVAFILPSFSLYSPDILSGISFFGQKIAGLNFFVFDIPKILTIFLALVQFEAVYFMAKKIASVINFFRGSGKLDI